MLYKKLKPVFQEHNKSIFTFENIAELIEEKYKPTAIEVVQSHNDGELIDDLNDNISSPEFESFFKVVIELNLHMVLNDPPITLNLLSAKERANKEDFFEKFEFSMFTKQDFYCIDGFPTEKMPAVAVLPAPRRDGYIYQGLKPAVIVFNEDNLQDTDLFEEGQDVKIKEHIQ